MDEATKAAIEAVANQLPVDKAYDDVAHGALAETGKALTDTVKVARLLMAPVQYVAAWQDSFARYCKRIGDKIQRIGGLSQRRRSRDQCWKLSVSRTSKR